MTKKIFSLILVVMLVGIVFLPVLAQADDAAAPSGDLNSDGLVNGNDGDIMQNIIAGQEQPTAGADLDGDGVISPADFAKLKVAEINASNTPADPSANTVSDQDVNPGDPNNDGQINYQDEGLLAEMVAGQIPANPSADLDGDGIISPADIAKVKTIIVTQGNAPQSDNALTQTEPLAAESQSAPLVNAAPATQFQMPNNPACAGITGDLNGDGLINEFDAEVIKQMIIGAEPFSACADLNNNGIIDPADSFLLNRLFLVDMPRNNIVLQPKDLSQMDAAGSNCTKGDANGDDKIDYKDLGIVEQIVSGQLPSNKAADLDGDGVVSPADIAKIKVVINNSHANSSAITPAERGNCNIAAVVPESGSGNVGGASNSSNPTFCQAVEYSDWSTCDNGLQTRTVLHSSFVNCLLSDEQKVAMQQTCQMPQAPELAPEVLGVKLYPDGSLLRAPSDMKIYVIENGLKRHIKTLKELAAKYFGLPILKVTLEDLAQYADAVSTK